MNTVVDRSRFLTFMVMWESEVTQSLANQNSSWRPWRGGGYPKLEVLRCSRVQSCHRTMVRHRATTSLFTKELLQGTEQMNNNK